MEGDRSAEDSPEGGMSFAEAGWIDAHRACPLAAESLSARSQTLRCRLKSEGFGVGAAAISSKDGLKGKP
jgi:hypothetical protein